MIVIDHPRLVVSTDDIHYLIYDWISPSRYDTPDLDRLVFRSLQDALRPRSLDEAHPIIMEAVS